MSSFLQNINTFMTMYFSLSSTGHLFPTSSIPFNSSTVLYLVHIKLFCYFTSSNEPSSFPVFITYEQLVETGIPYINVVGTAVTLKSSMSYSASILLAEMFTMPYSFSISTTFSVFSCRPWLCFIPVSSYLDTNQHKSLTIIFKGISFLYNIFLLFIFDIFPFPWWIMAI